MPASAIDDMPIAHSHACAACGAPVDELDKFCNSCGLPQNAARARQADAAAQRPDQADQQRVFHCETCGADVAVDPQTRSYVCPFCESTYVVELPTSTTPPGGPGGSDAVIRNRQRPEFVIGFSVTPEMAEQKFRAWTKQGGWFHPGDLSQSQVAQRLRGVYLPFWSFSMLAQSRWSATIGEYWYRTETYTVTVNGKTETRTRQVQETEWWPLDGRHHRYYSGYLVSASRGLPQQFADSVQPFRTEALKRYQPFYLAGWLAEEYSIEREAAEQLCRTEFTNWAQRDIGAFLPGDTHRELAVDVDFSEVNSDLILLPIYLLTYRYQDRQYRFLLNGQTGRVFGERPLSKQRIALAVAAGVLVLIVLYLIVRFFG